MNANGADPKESSRVWNTVAVRQFTLLVQAAPVMTIKPRPLENVVLRMCARCACLTMHFLLGAGFYECSECGKKS